MDQKHKTFLILDLLYNLEIFLNFYLLTTWLILQFCLLFLGGPPSSTKHMNIDYLIRLPNVISERYVPTPRHHYKIAMFSSKRFTLFSVSCEWNQIPDITTKSYYILIQKCCFKLPCSKISFNNIYLPIGQ